MVVGNQGICGLVTVVLLTTVETLAVVEVVSLVVLVVMAEVVVDLVLVPELISFPNITFFAVLVVGRTIFLAVLETVGNILFAPLERLEREILFFTCFFSSFPFIE